MKRYEVTKHAVNRAIERLGFTKNEAENRLNQLMQTAYYNGRTTGYGTVANVYDNHNHRIRFIVSDANEIVTVYKFPEHTEVEAPRPKLSEVPTFLSEKVAKVVQRELERFESNERKIERKNTLIIAELRIELAEIDYRLLRARSEAKIMSLKARKSAVEMRIDELNNEIIEVKREKSIIAKGVAAYL